MQSPVPPRLAKVREAARGPRPRPYGTAAHSGGCAHQLSSYTCAECVPRSSPAVPWASALQPDARRSTAGQRPAQARGGARTARRVAGARALSGGERQRHVLQRQTGRGAGAGLPRARAGAACCREWRATLRRVERRVSPSTHTASPFSPWRRPFSPPCASLNGEETWRWTPSWHPTAGPLGGARERTPLPAGAAQGACWWWPLRGDYMATRGPRRWSRGSSGGGDGTLTSSFTHFLPVLCCVALVSRVSERRPRRAWFSRS